MALPRLSLCYVSTLGKLLIISTGGKTMLHRIDSVPLKIFLVPDLFLKKERILEKILYLVSN